MKIKDYSRFDRRPGPENNPLRKGNFDPEGLESVAWSPSRCRTENSFIGQPPRQRNPSLHDQNRFGCPG